MNEEHERLSALALLDNANYYAELYSEEQDVSAATAAIIMRAFELATQDLSVERRNKLLKGEFE